MKAWILLAASVLAGVVVIEVLGYAFPLSSSSLVVPVASGVLVFCAGIAAKAIRTRQLRRTRSTAVR